MKFTTPIEHVVVLMMENHSFDNMLGWLPGVGELTGDESITGSDSTVYRVGDYHGDGKNPPFRTKPGPAHDFPDVNIQIFGTEFPSAGAVPTMSGFVQDYPGPPGNVMGCYSKEQVPVISKLAKTFTVCRRWFCSVPGPTGPNRIYANCASSKGYAGSAYSMPKLPTDLADLPSIFQVLGDGGYSWGTYYEDWNFATELVLSYVLPPMVLPTPDPGFVRFLGDLEGGKLPNYSFLTPSLLINSQHPSDDIRTGECLMATIYEGIANSSYWEKTLFIITYDEHGGFYDSVCPPTGVNPDGHKWKESPPFDFDRLGVRVPAILISPYVQAGVDDTPYEHSSIPKTVLQLFGGLKWPLLPNGMENRRIKWVNTFESAVGKTLRTDLPMKLLRPPGDDYIPFPPAQLPT